MLCEDCKVRRRVGTLAQVNLLKIGTGEVRSLRFEHRDGVALGVALHSCAKCHHIGSLFDTLSLCVEGEFNLWWQRVERHAVHVLLVEKAVQKGFDQFVTSKDLHGVYGEVVESREDSAELELQVSIQKLCNTYKASTVESGYYESGYYENSAITK